MATKPKSAPSEAGVPGTDAAVEEGQASITSSVTEVVAPDVDAEGEDTGARPRRVRRRWRAEAPLMGDEERPIRTGSRGERPRTPIVDLPPDRQAEIRGSQVARRMAREHIRRPNMPVVEKPLELHTPEIGILYTRSFKACSEYAVAIDEVAKHRLERRAAYNAYLEEFDGYLKTLQDMLEPLVRENEGRANGAKTSSREPLRFHVQLETHRSMQLLRLYEHADLVLRHAGYLHIYGEMEPRDYDRLRETVTRAFQRCIKGLRKVKRSCFLEIMAETRLRLPYRDDLRLNDVLALSSHQQRAAQRDNGGRGRGAAPRPDPTAKASAPVIGEGSVEPGDTDEAAEEGGGTGEAPPHAAE